MTSRPYHARATDPQTSIDFAAAMNERYPAQWAEILADLRAHGASTYREVAQRTGIDGTSTSTAMTKMEARGLLRRLRQDDGTLARRHGAMLREATDDSCREVCPDCDNTPRADCCYPGGPDEA